MYRFLLLALLLINALTLEANAQDRFEMNDIFPLQYANDIQIAPNGQHIVYRRMGFDVMQDRSTGALWIMKADGSNHQKLTCMTGTNLVHGGLQVVIELRLHEKGKTVQKFISIGLLQGKWRLTQLP